MGVAMMYLHNYRKAFFGTLLTSAFLAGCDGSSSNFGSLPDVIDNGGTIPQADISPAVLDSAASFLGAATGKEIPLSVDSVIFINSALGLNDVPNDPQNLFGDLWMIVRDAYGAPVLDTQGCVQPIASETITLPDGTTTDTVPMVIDTLEEEPVCAVEEGYEQYTIELEIGRLNMVRTMTQNPTVFARALEEAIKNINASESIKLDPAGRLILVSSDPVTGLPVENTIDSPRENLALYNALLKEGRIAGFGPEKHEGGQTIAPQWLEIREDLDLGDLAYLRDGTPGRDHGVDLHDGYADLSQAVHDRQLDYATQTLSYIQYYDDGSACHYRDETGYAWEQVFGLEDYNGVNINGFMTHADDARRTIVFMHDVIQDMPEAPLQTLPTADGRFDLMHAAASFLGGASNKSVPLTIDGLVFINTVLGLNEGVDFTNKGEVFGDLWELERDVNGVPVLDENGCPQPISVNGGFVPMVLDPDSGECEIVEGFEDEVIELELGRLNVVRVALTNPRVLDRALYDVVENSINNSVGLQLDLSGRLAYGVEDAEAGTVTYKTVDSPLAGLAMYWALMRWGSLEGDVEIMVDGSWVTHTLVIDDASFTDVTLAEAGLEFLKADSSSSGVGHLPSGYVDYSTFTHTTETIYSGAEVDFVERQPDDLSCAYGDRTEDVWERVLGSDQYSGVNIEAFVKQAEDTRNVIQFIHTVIQDPLPEAI
ncbi:hypothetical protein [Marinobacter pelagius]|uniref:Uncharacterized protein n=1 Tax=Marinobacter pelagius TaxID=379482 RepID=A0A1I4ZQ47_9GAMM|nr:hypothetical protein [Marinobacter pelagius]SFN52278.1 hypothetical protein SAMN04487961_3309 [Marinobacter pelagius]